MVFWIATILMAVLVSLLLGLAMRRGHAQTDAAADYDLRVYRDQLKEVDRDLARGVIEPGDAERVRTEVSRRILAADTQMQGDTGGVEQPAMVNRFISGVVMVAMLGGAFALYLQLGAPGYGDLALKTRIEAAKVARDTRPKQNVAEASLPQGADLSRYSADYVALVEKLRETVATRPDDLQGHILLAQNEAAMGNFIAAYRAQQQVVRLKGDAVAAADLADLGDMMILAAGGYVSPEAESALAQALELDPENGPALYYYGLMLAQTGRPDQAFLVWDRLLRNGPPDAPWIEPIRAQIEDMADRAGAKFTLPPMAAPSDPTAPGPSAEDVAAAAQMSAAERTEMIQNMVNGLSDRLATEGGPPPDWARLIGALAVLGETDRARAIYQEATRVFADTPEALAVIDTSARSAKLIP